MHLEKYSIGVGDRFGLQASAQLRAVQDASSLGIAVVPVWNKSHREHTSIGSNPADTRLAADTAVKECGWEGSYYVDADHINRNTVDHFIESSDFFTIDVAEYIGMEPEQHAVERLVKRFSPYISTLNLPDTDTDITITEETIERYAHTYARVIAESASLYRTIAQQKGGDLFITEVSCDETEKPQNPSELFFILGALAAENVPVQTIAPKFTGEFYKGIDYVGDISRFEQEFAADTAVVALAIKEFGLPENLKLSVHSGSDKFSLYPVINRIIKGHGCGLHLKTAGTTWLEELCGLAMGGGEGCATAKEIYSAALARYDELYTPYATVLDIDRNALPTPETVAKWDSTQFAAALRHNQQDPSFNPHLRQLLHIAYKIAAEMGDRYLHLVKKHEKTIGAGVKENILERHIKPIFG
jgi:hypothetical protein